MRSGSFDPTTPTDVTPTVAEAELLLEEARQAEAERAAASARQAEDDRRRRASLEHETVADVDALEERLGAEIAAMRAAEISPDRELRALGRGFLHGFAPRGFKRVPPEDLIAARDDAGARLLELAREAELLYDRLTNSWSDVPLAVDHPLVRRVDAVEAAAWRAFVERVRILSGEASHVEIAEHEDSVVRWS